MSRRHQYTKWLYWLYGRLEFLGKLIENLDGEKGYIKSELFYSIAQVFCVGGGV